ncbi:hypothetical protein ABZ671_00710 [Micromonospora sp. NPDC006766]|uniref:hypothetical protein n=1 Tax=Micromonospora sp. NPDC006766 TaxID=3154778 RepID=UPI0033C4D7A3
MTRHHQPPAVRGADYGQPSPAWIVLGTPVGNGQVAVYASKDLSGAELTREEDPFETMLGGLPPYHHAGPHRIELTVGMHRYTVVVADTYEQAFHRLFATWSPEPERPALPTQPQGPLS